MSNTATTHPASISAAQIRVVALCALVTLIEGIDLTLIPALGPKIIHAWSVSSKAFGLMLSAGTIGTMVGGVGVGYLADRIGRRNALIAAMVLMTGATLVTTFTSSISQLLVCRFVAGVSFGGVIPVAVALVSESLPPRARASVIVFVFLGQAGGGLLAAVLAKIPSPETPWQTSIYYCAAGCALVCLLLLTMLPESPRYLLVRGGRRNHLRDLFLEGRAAGTVLLWLTFIGVCLPTSFFTNYLTSMFAYAGKPNEVGIDAIGFYSGGAMFGGLVLPLFSQRWNVNKVLLGTIVLAIGAVIAMGWVLSLDNTTGLVLATLCGVSVSGAFFMLYPPAARFYPTHIRATGIGAAIAFGRIGNTISPTAAGFMIDAKWDPTSVFYAMAAPMVLSCIALIAFDRLTSTAGEAANAQELSDS